MKIFGRKKHKTPISCNTDKPYYVYTGPMDTRIKGNWVDNDAYKRKTQKAPTGSIQIVHKNIEMLCRVTDNLNLPGFLITCKDENGDEREFQLYLSPDPANRGLVLCTSNDTNRNLFNDEVVKQLYPVPFKATKCK